MNIDVINLNTLDTLVDEHFKTNELYHIDKNCYIYDKIKNEESIPYIINELIEKLNDNSITSIKEYEKEIKEHAKVVINVSNIINSEKKIINITLSKDFEKFLKFKDEYFTVINKFELKEINTPEDYKTSRGKFNTNIESYTIYTIYIRNITNKDEKKSYLRSLNNFSKSYYLRGIITRNTSDIKKTYKEFLNSIPNNLTCMDNIVTKLKNLKIYPLIVTKIMSDIAIYTKYLYNILKKIIYITLGVNKETFDSYIDSLIGCIEEESKDETKKETKEKTEEEILLKMEQDLIERLKLLEMNK